MAKNIFSRAAKDTKQAAEKYMGDDITMRGTLTAAAIVGSGVNAGKALHDIASKSKKEMQKNTDKNSDVSISEKRTQKEFEKTDDALRDVETAREQRGGTREDRPREIQKARTDKRERVPERDKTMEREAERVKRAAKQREAEAMHQRMKEEEQRHERLQDGKENAMEHDMTEQVLGQTYKVPGTNISYEDAKIMAENNIRDSAELTGISLEDDGFADSVAEIQDMMKGYAFNGVPDIDDVYALANERNYGAGVIAQAYVNVLKEVDINQNIQALTKIDEKFCFEHQAFETQFDYIREHDSAADRVLDKVEMELGRERE